MKRSIFRYFSSTIAVMVILFTAGIRIALGQAVDSASIQSMYEAGSNAGSRLQSQGDTLRNLDDVLVYSHFLSSYTTQTVYFDVTRKGRYILLVGGDNDTKDLNIKLYGVGVDNTYGNKTGFIIFDVHQPGRFWFDINMLGCRAQNCGVFAVLLNTKS